MVGGFQHRLWDELLIGIGIGSVVRGSGRIRSMERLDDVTEGLVMAISESSRLHSSLQKESVPIRRLIVNQVLPPSTSDCRFCAIKRKDQTHALDMIRTGLELKGLNIIQAPLVDMEIRGVLAHNFLGDILWK
ncbi:P-loop containing nucleoside triphosphate hydrolase superfamily protein [Zea mays]|uniref:p-loop containing nucleoside triphosphate hydrolase superfamily protein n=1 Tax=Zea mays TaxID=4577 RepID=A0A1D6NL95_MAIZE|nr:P-loop containing nucleoside triphosphate hydrolase superfamily protein [Zea mays]